MRAAHLLAGIFDRFHGPIGGPAHLLHGTLDGEPSAARRADDLAQ